MHFPIFQFSISYFPIYSHSLNKSFSTLVYAHSFLSTSYIYSYSFNEYFSTPIYSHSLNTQVLLFKHIFTKYLSTPIYSHSLMNSPVLCNSPNIVGTVLPVTRFHTIRQLPQSTHLFTIYCCLCLTFLHKYSCLSTSMYSHSWRST